MFRIFTSHREPQTFTDSNQLNWWDILPFLEFFLSWRNVKRCSTKPCPWDHTTKFLSIVNQYVVTTLFDSHKPHAVFPPILHIIVRIWKGWNNLIKTSCCEFNFKDFYLSFMTFVFAPFSIEFLWKLSNFRIFWILWETISSQVSNLN